MPHMDLNNLAGGALLERINKVKVSIKQLRMISFIQTYSATNGYPPTVREISKVASLSVSTVHGHLTRMQEKGLIEWQRSRQRTLKIIYPHTMEVGA